MRLPCHLPVFYRNHSSASWWQVPRRFPGSFMRSGCSSSWSWFKCVPCSLIPLWNRGVEAQRSGTPAFRGLGASCPQHRGSGTGLCCRLSPSPKHLFNPSSCTPKPTVRTSVAFLSKTEHSLAQEENRVGKLCHSAIWWYLPRPYGWQGLDAFPRTLAQAQRNACALRSWLCVFFFPPRLPGSL